MSKCTLCKFQVYESRTSEVVLCLAYSAKPPSPAKNFPVNLTEVHWDYPFSIPEWCTRFEKKGIYGY